MSDDDDILAAEHALGLTDASARVEADAAFARAVDAWRARLLPMTEDKAPPPELWTRIAQTLPAPEPVAAPAPARANGWRVGALGASALAAALLAIVVLRPGLPDAPPAPAGPAPTQVASAGQPRVMVAALMPERGDSMVSVTFDKREGRMTVMPMRMKAPPGRAPELWVVPEDGTPRSLGVIPDSAPATMMVAAAHRSLLDGGVMLAVTLEPMGGSPTGLPTGPIVMKGKMQLA